MNRTRLWRIIQNSSWLLGGLALLGVAFFLWIGVQIHHRLVVEKTTENQDVPIEPEKVRFSPTLGMLTDMVPELNLNKDVDSATHGAEFRGASFLKEQNNRWTLQLMNVTQEEVIKSYLEKQANRQQFYYFRYVQPGQPEHFLLTFGSFKSVSEALSVMKKTDFGLPGSMKVMPQQFSAYSRFVTDDVGSEDNIVNLAGSNKLYAVNLRMVPVPVDFPSAPATSTPVINPQDKSGVPHATTDSILPATPAVTGNPAATSTGTTAPTAANTGNNPIPATTESQAPVADPFN